MAWTSRGSSGSCPVSLPRVLDVEDASAGSGPASTGAVMRCHQHDRPTPIAGRLPAEPFLCGTGVRQLSRRYGSNQSRFARLAREERNLPPFWAESGHWRTIGCSRWCSARQGRSPPASAAVASPARIAGRLDWRSVSDETACRSEARRLQRRAREEAPRARRSGATSQTGAACGCRGSDVWLPLLTSTPSNSSFHALVQCGGENPGQALACAAR